VRWSITQTHVASPGDPVLLVAVDTVVIEPPRSALLPSLHLAFEHHEVVHELLHAGAGRSRDALGRGVIRRSGVPPSFSVRRDSERASRRSAVIAFAGGGSGLSMPPSIIPLILRRTTTASRWTAPRHQCRKLDPRSGS